MTTDDKMFYIAKHFNYLNDKGKVKAIKGNEKGYAKIKDIVRGCSLFVHHMNNDQLIINLLISPAAKSSYELVCNKAVKSFDNHFKSQVEFTPWKNCMDKSKVYDRYCINVTNKELPELLIIIEEIRNKLEVA
jgi:hypothetical protein